jgi:hypothetical protein
MTKSRRIDYRNVEAQPGRLGTRRVVALASGVVVVAAVAFVVESLRRSVAQLGSAASGFTVEVRGVLPPPSYEPPAATPTLASPTSTSPAIPASSELETVVEVPADEGPAEIDGSLAAPSPDPISGAEFARLLASGALGDADADPEAAAELRRALEAAEALATHP